MTRQKKRNLSRCECDGGGGGVCGRDIVSRPRLVDSRRISQRMLCSTHSRRITMGAKNVVVIVAVRWVTRAPRVLGAQQQHKYLNGAVGGVGRHRRPREKSRGGWVDAAAAAALDSPAAPASRDLWRCARYLDAPELEGALELPAPSHAAPTPSSRHPLRRCAAAGAGRGGGPALRLPPARRRRFSAAFSQAPPHFCERSRPSSERACARGWILAHPDRTRLVLDPRAACFRNLKAFF
jgi:hypothetical protein